MTSYVVSTRDYLRGLLRPMSGDCALDPFALKKLAKTSPRRIAWTAQSRVIEAFATATYRANLAVVRRQPATHAMESRGDPIEGTAVTTGQRLLLLKALAAASGTKGDVAEIGAYRGVTTCAMARESAKTIYAVDPFIGYGGAELELRTFTEATRPFANVKHVRKTSGEAAADFVDGSLALVFIDGVHDFSNCWFDFNAWAPRVTTGGFVALHDVDDHPGVTLACRRICGDTRVRLWGYCPNLVIFQRVT